MSLLEILKYPNPNLNKVAADVTEFNEEIKNIIQNMLDTMYVNNGIGLAATQVDIHKRIIVMDLSEQKNEPIIMINPKIIFSEGEVSHEEGCLSFPGISLKIKRAASLKVEYQDINGEQNTCEADGLMAICIQHEIDHINGVTFFDRLSPLKKKLAKAKFEKANI